MVITTNEVVPSRARRRRNGNGFGQPEQMVAQSLGEKASIFSGYHLAGAIAAGVSVWLITRILDRYFFKK